MRRQVQSSVGLLASALEIVGIVYFLAWLRTEDWLFGHTHGPPGYLIAATGAASVGIVLSGLWIAFSFPKVFTSTVPQQPQPRSIASILLTVTVILLMLPSGMIAAIGITKFPQARLRLQIDRMDSGAADIAELVTALDSQDYHVRWSAMQALKKLGPKASPATSALARSLSDVALRNDAAMALAAIGPEAHPAIPALIESMQLPDSVVPSGSVDETSIFSWLAAVALTQIGPTALPELIPLLSHANHRIRKNAARAIGNMGPLASDAIPALTLALNDEVEEVRERARIALEQIANRRPVIPPPVL